MPLTSEIKRPKSQISLWLSENFDIRAIAKTMRAQVDSIPTLTPAGDLQQYPWSIIGHATEARLVQALGLSYYEFARPGRPDCSRIDDRVGLSDALAVLWEDYRGSAISDPTSAWIAYIAGNWEYMYRGGKDSLDLQGERQAELQKFQSCDEWKEFCLSILSVRAREIEAVRSQDHPVLLELQNIIGIENIILDDIANVTSVTLAGETYQEINKTWRLVYDPIFVGSGSVGGADGDLISGHTLYDVKTTIHPSRLWSYSVKQLIGYTALDTHGDCEIEEIAVWLPRQNGSAAMVSIEEVLSYSQFESLTELQHSWGSTYGARRFDHDGYALDGYNSEGFNRSGLNRQGLTRSKVQNLSYDDYDYGYYDHDGYDQDGWNLDGLDRQGYKKEDYALTGFNPKGFDHYGYDRQGISKMSVNLVRDLRGKYDAEGYDRSGYDCNGYNRDGWNRKGFDVSGVNCYGFADFFL